MAFIALFFTFGPNVEGQPIVMIGFQLYWLASIGIFATYLWKPSVLAVYVVFAIYLFLAVCGTLSIFGFSSPVYNISNAACLQYFDGAKVSTKRCADGGLLNFIRLLGLSAPTILFFSLAYIFGEYPSESITQPSAPAAPQQQQNDQFVPVAYVPPQPLPSQQPGQYQPL